MNIIEAFILGIIQGATEFLPISSDGHSVLIPAMLGLNQPTLGMVVLAHMGTWLAVVIYFRRDLWQIMTMAWVSLREGQLMAYPESRLAWYLLIGCVPAALVGLLFENWFEAIFANVYWTAVFLIVTGLILIIGEKLLSGNKQLAEMSWLDAMTIGLFQVIALLPGLSRSGSTIMAGLLRGLSRESAARYSFLLSIPIILGAGLVKLPGLFSGGGQEQLSILLITFLTSAIVGFFCIHFLMNWLRHRNLYPFAIYCITFGLLYLLFSWT